MNYSGKTIYICEDDLALLELLKEIAEQHQFTVYTQTNGKDCLHAILDKKPDLIISDINMPEMDGLSLLKTLYKLDSNIPVIFITGDPNPKHLIGAVAYNHFDFLIKPLDYQKLEESIKKAMAFGYQNHEHKSFLDLKKKST